jgi:hypothetical protein
VDGAELIDDLGSDLFGIAQVVDLLQGERFGEDDDRDPAGEDFNSMFAGGMGRARTPIRDGASEGDEVLGPVQLVRPASAGAVDLDLHRKSTGRLVGFRQFAGAVVEAPAARRVLFEAGMALLRRVRTVLSAVCLALVVTALKERLAVADRSATALLAGWTPLLHFAVKDSPA